MEQFLLTAYEDPIITTTDVLNIRNCDTINKSKIIVTAFLR